jgi:hypothetical protein
MLRGKFPRAILVIGALFLMAAKCGLLLWTGSRRRHIPEAGEEGR